MSPARRLAARADRWRALVGLLVTGGRGTLAGFGALVLAAGLLPTVVILATGAFVAALPAVAGQGLAGPAARPAVLAFAAVVLALVGRAVCATAAAHVSRVIDDALSLEVHRRVAAVTLGTPGLEPLDDPARADRLQAIHEADRRGVLRRTAACISTIGTTRVRGLGALVVLLAFSWWAPLLLAGAWYLTNRLFMKVTEKGISFDSSAGPTRLRRAAYVRSLAMGGAAAKEVRVFGLGEWVVARYGEAWLDALQMMWSSRRSSRGLTTATAVALAVSHGVVLAALALAVSRGELTAAALVVFVQAVIATVDLGIVGDQQFFLAQSLATAERVARLVTDTPPPSFDDEATLPAHASAASPAAAPAPTDRVALRLDGVRFTYGGRERPTLDGLTLEVPAGQSLAVVGENGAGKSTLIKLLCGLYTPQDGSIALDGGMSPREARGRVAAIFQDFARYPLPLRENVAFGHLPLAGDPAALQSALDDAGAGDLPGRLPHGWDTVLSREYEHGTDLSGGQWQRVALARALVAVRGGAGLLILDEPTANLDVRAETELFERFLEVTRGVTTILVSHRLSSVRRADRIVVIDDGRVVEDGSHNALMAAGGRYAAMFRLQADRFAAEAAGVGEETGEGEETGVEEETAHA
ncbi:MAG TPA: ABC transporter ATP-binding protein [Longimicrobium sp.]|nr:ABC transporter ATP-binding protein [Longimicrobium sp.]